ncbi:MAG TPA: LysE family translocator [Stellaceae bacterium]|nr:LysE family translocator [Stellaceae bacterium]
MLAALLAFTLAAAVLTVTPGLDTALVLRTAVVEGPARAMVAGLGICCGLFGWGLLVSAGLGALLAVSELAFDALRIAGALYLLYLGTRLLLRLRGPASPLAIEPDAGEGARGDVERRRWFVRGLLTNLLNPKVGAFYVTFLPQFIPAGVNVVWFSLLLAAIHAVEGVLWFALLTRASAAARRWLVRPTVQRTLDGVTGGLFLLFGVRLAVEYRH